MIVKPNVDALVSSLCSGEIDALFSDVRTIERRLVDRPPDCQSLKLIMTLVPGATLPLGSASSREARNPADLLFTRINDLVADGTLANMASAYQLASPDSNVQLAQLLQNRQHNLLLQAACIGLGCLLVIFAAIGVRIRAAHLAIEDTRLKLEESEQRFHAFMNHLSANAFMKDSAGRYVYVNNACSKALNVPVEECLGKSNHDLVPAATAEMLRAHDRIVIESNEAGQFMEEIPDHYGNARHWLTFKFPFRSRSGEVFLGGVSLEVTKMIQAQNALRESESRYRQIVEFAGDIILRCDVHGRVTYINEMGERILKFSASGLHGRRALDLVAG